MKSHNCAIVLDNCEHVIDTASEVVEAVLRAAPDVRILATSREPLRAESECVHLLSALDLPLEAADGASSAAEVVRFSAVELFVGSVSPLWLTNSSVTDSDAPLIAAVCRKLTGNPLAIELAAARVETFGVAGLLDGLIDGLSVLTRGRRTAPPRHGTLRATLDWSFGLLSDTEKIVFGRLGVFAADFTRESVALVVPDEYLDALEAVDALDNLVAKSLVAVSSEQGRIAFRLLDLTRAYAFEKLRDDPLASDVHRRHVRYLGAMIDNSGLKQCVNGPKPLAPLRLGGTLGGNRQCDVGRHLPS